MRYRASTALHPCPGRPLPLRTLIAATALCLATQAHPQDNNPPSGTDKLREGVSALQRLLSGGKADAAPAAQPTPTVPGANLNQPLATNYRALFAKGNVSGEDLYETLKALRLQMQAKKSAKAAARVNLALERILSEQALSGKLDVGSVVQNMLLPEAVKYLKSHAAIVATQSLDDYLQYLLEDRRAALAEETVKLPPATGIDDVQANRIVTMAALVAAARVSAKVLDKADKDFKALQTDYKALIEQREKAADLFFKTVDQRRAAVRAGDAARQAQIEGDLSQTLSANDLAFIDTALNTMNFKEFVADMAAQNLAINYLRTKDSAAYQDYRTKADEVVRRTQAYVRTVTGVAAFGALTMSFGQTILEIGTEKKIDNILSALPLAGDFVVAAFPLAEKAVSVAAQGVVLPLGGNLFAPKRAFTIIRPEKTETVSDASAVFKVLRQTQAGELFVGALFNGETAGWLNRVRLCDPAETGRMLDAAVPLEVRTKFANDYFAFPDSAKASEFAFSNALPSPGATRRERELGNELLGRDHRARADALPLADVQRTVEQNYSKWSNDQLMRIIFYNLESSAAYATLQMGDVLVRPVPSPASLFAYESRVEACRKAGEEALAAAAPEPATPPAASTPAVSKKGKASGGTGQRTGSATKN